MNKEIQELISEKLDKNVITGKVILQNFRLIDNQDRYSPAYLDNRNYPFYYYLGSLLPSKSIFEYGFGLGLVTGSYAKGCKTIESITTFQEKTKEYYSPRLGKNNVKDYFKGKLEIIYDTFTNLKLERKFDLIFVNEKLEYDKFLLLMEILWEKLEVNGSIVVNYADKAFEHFCLRKNREKLIFNTRNKVGVITK